MKRTSLISICNYCILIAIVSLQACVKDKGDYDYVNPKTPFNGSTYAYLQSKPGIFDSLLFVLNRVNLIDSIKQNNHTLFAPTNASFTLALQNLNTVRISNGLKPLYLKDYDASLLDSILCRYIFKGKYLSDSLQFSSGRPLSGIKYNYPMNGEKVQGESAGYIGGGPTSIAFSDTKRASFAIKWKTSSCNSIDITTATGVVHILEPVHVFGFDNFSGKVNMPYTGSLFQLPPIIGNKVILEAENFDLGGQNVAYHDNNTGNAGNNYRTTEDVDIYTHAASTTNTINFPSGYDIGSTSAGEWLLYSINVPVDGDYKFETRQAVPGPLTNKPSSFHLEIDYVNVTGHVLAPPTVSSVTYNTWTLIPQLLHLKAGKRVFRFYFEVAPIQLDCFVITRVN